MAKQRRANAPQAFAAQQPPEKSGASPLIAQADTCDFSCDSTPQFSGLTEFAEPLAASPDHDALLETTLGNVKLVRLVGEGGMGRVYEGQQERPHRTVAVKVIRPGVVSPHLVRRFEYEAQMLARLTHPGIAQIHSIGSQDVEGRLLPFFVMEFITDAKPLTDFADDRSLPTHDRVALFQKVCDAVAHGHHKGVIHRDLKPSNILVDSTGQPKVIDFGVARTTDADILLTTMHTDVGQLVGTLQYMCPEQFAADPDDIDVRADVYALGVVLYELLVGKPPYELKKKAVFEAARIVREVDPTPLSSWNRTLRGDIATIAAKCLEKDRTKRYSGAGELAADLGRYLAGDPIAATPPRLIDAVIRLARRHRAAAVATGGVLATLVLAIIGISFFAWRADEARRKALMERQRAESHAAAAAAAESRANTERVAAQRQLYRASIRASDSGISEHNSQAAMSAKAQAVGLLEFSGIPSGGDSPIEMRVLDAAWNTSLENLATGTPPVDAVGFAIHGDRLAMPPQVWEWHEGRALPLGSILPSSSPCRIAAVSRKRGVMARVHANGVCEIIGLDTLRTEAIVEALPGRITAAAFSPGGKRLVLTSHNFEAGRGTGLLTIWDTHSWQRITGFASPRPVGPHALALSPVDDVVAIGSGTTAEVRSFAEPDRAVILGGHRGIVSGVAFSPDGTRVATGSVNPDWSGTVTVWNTQTGTLLGTLQCNPGRSAWHARLVFAPTGDRIGIIFGDRHAHLWNGTSRESVQLVGHGGRVFRMTFFPEGDEVATCSADSTVRTWNVATGRPTGVFMGLRDEVTHLAIDDDGGLIAAADATGEVAIWSASPRLQPSVLLAPDGVTVTQLVVRPDGHHVAASCNDGILRIWDAVSGVPLAGLTRRKGKPGAGWAHLAYSRDGVLLAATAYDGLTAVWEAHTGRLVHALPTPGDRGRSVVFSDDGRFLAAGFVGGKATVWETSSGRETATMGAVQSDIGCCRIAFGLAGARLATGTVELWNPATGEPAAQLVGEGKVTSLAVSPDGRLFASTTMSGAASVWDAATGARVCNLTAHHEASRVVGFSPDGTIVATGGFDMVVRLSEARTGKLVHTLRGHTGWIQYLAFSPDGRRLVTGSWDNTARVWDTESGELLLVLRGHDDYVKGLAFSPDGNRIYSCSFDGTVRIWGSSNRELVRESRRFQQRAAHLRSIVDSWLEGEATELTGRLDAARGELSEDDFRIATGLLLQKAVASPQP